MEVTFLKKIKYVIIITFCVLLVYGCTNTLVYASEEESVEDSSLKEYINEYIKDIESNIKLIDEQINEMKSQKEYTKYPAVRLNVQTPFLGIAAITESKLNIKEGVSVIDRNYSLREVINKKIIKVPSFSIGSITILTKQLDLTSNKLNSEEENLALYYLKIYLSQAKEVVNFVKQQKSNIFFDYVPKEIKEKVQEQNQRIEKIKKGLVDSNNKLKFIFFVGYKEDEYTTLEDSYKSIYDDCLKLEEQLKNILITSEQLDKLGEEIEVLEKKFEKYYNKINYIYDMECLNINQIQVIDGLYNEIKTLEELIKEYVGASKEFIPISNIEKINQDVKSKTDENEATGYEENIIYKVKNEEILTEIANFKKEILKYKDNIKEENGETVNRVYTNDEYIKFVDEYASKYALILSSSCRFYETNYFYMLQDTSLKLDELIKNTDVSVTKYMKDIYFNIPDDFERIKKYDLNSIFYTKKYISDLSKNLNKVVTYNIEINKMYEQKVEEGKIKS